DLRDDRFLARLLRIRLPVDVTAGLDVEEMDLAVDGGEVALGVEDDARVRELLSIVAALCDRPADEGDPMAARPARERSHGLAGVELLGGCVQFLRMADGVPFLGEDDDVGARRGGLGHEPLGLLEVVSLVRTARHLDAGDPDPFGHRANDSFASWKRRQRPSPLAAYASSTPSQVETS